MSKAFNAVFQRMVQRAISVIPHYGNAGSGIPTEIEYNYGTLEDGNMKHCVITQFPTGGTTRGSADCPGM
jgi:hypothetical protein